MGCDRWLAPLVLLTCCMLVGACNQVRDDAKGSNDKATAEAVQDSENQSDAEAANAAEAKREKEPEPESLIKTSFLRSDSPTAAAAKHPGLSELAAVNKVTAALTESIEGGPTLVVWLFDTSHSASRMVSGIQAALISFYEKVAVGEVAEGASNNLFTAVVAFGSNVQFLIDDPTSNTSEVAETLNTFERDTGSKELTFTAVGESLQKYREYRTLRRYDVIFVVVTDESGDDREAVEAVIESPEYSPRRLGIPVYVIGVPAPFGRTAGLEGGPEKGNIRQGPESREIERISLAFWGSSYGLDLIDSGFGPFELEWLCRDSGGLFLAVRPEFNNRRRFQSQFENKWPTLNAGRFDPQVMRRYAPQYESSATYWAKVNKNRAKQALLNAAKLRRTDVDRLPPIEFTVTTQARLQQDVTGAQQAAARLEPEVGRFYEVLRAGEVDREKLTEPRWQAGFDLAMGRVMATKARVEGYNEMLAALKRGKKFENPDSNRWQLEPAAITVDAGSGLVKLGEKARMYLRRVVEEHPDTPWAKIAAQELKADIGWRWVERGPGSFQR